jgi:hypothetical protein
MGNFPKIIFSFIGGMIGWIIKEFEPTFPLAIVAVIFIVYDAWTASKLDKRVHVKFPDETARHDAKFSSSRFGVVVRHTIPERLALIFLAYLLEHWVFIHVNIPLSYVATGVICFEQLWSILENESSCREDGEGKFYKILQRIMVDKTERHFDVNLEDFRNTRIRKRKNEALHDQ